MASDWRYIGIDPGLAGGIATISPRGRVLRVVKMPPTEYALLDELKIASGPDPAFAHAVLEDVHATPQMGVVSAFTFGVGLGKILMALEANDIEYVKVSPVRWQTVIGCRTPKERRAELGQKDKNINKARAQELFPTTVVTHANADALMLAEYARRTHRGLLLPPSAE